MSQATVTKKILSVEIVHEYDSDPDISWLDDETDPEGERRDQLNRSVFEFIGIYAKASVAINGVYQKIQSGGLWGIESDSDKDYLESIDQEEMDALTNILQAIGFSRRQIEATAV